MLSFKAKDMIEQQRLVVYHIKIPNTYLIGSFFNPYKRKINIDEQKLHHKQ